MTRRLARLAMPALLLASAGRARGQDLDRSKQPTTAAVPAFAFPKIRTHRLSNGLRLIVAEEHSLPLVAVRVVLGVDSTADPPGKEGLYAVTLGALREGTASNSAEQLAEAFADIGTTVTPTGFTTTTPGFAHALALIGDMLMHPSLDEAGIQRRKTLQAAVARRLPQTTAAIPRHLFYARLYGADDPLVRSLLPSETSIASITREDVARFHQENFQPPTTTVIVVGDVSDEQASSAVTRVFGRWTASKPSANGHPVNGSAPSRERTAIYLHDVPGTQAYLYVGARGPTRTSPDFYAVETMGVISGMRMQQTLRDQRSFMYSGNSGVIWRRATRPSAFVGSTVVNATKVDSAIVEWLSLLRGLADERLATSQELASVRRSRVDPLPARIDGVDSLAARLVDMVRDDVPLDFFDRYATGITNVTASDVAAAASKYIDLDRLIIVVTGDRSVIEPALRAANIAPVVVVDANGKPIDK